MILVFGKNGQVATELARRGDVTTLGRDDADLADPARCAEIILDRKPAAIINAACCAEEFISGDNSTSARTPAIARK